MKWLKRLQEIERLKAKYGKDRSLARSFPDLQVEQRTAPCTNLFGDGRSPVKPSMPQDHGLLVGAPHKQGVQVLPKSEIMWAGGKKS